MQKYVRQLIGDLRAAAWPDDQEPPPDVSRAHTLKDEFAAMEAWFEDAGPKERIGDLLQLAAVQFPPAEKLNRRQLRGICEAYEKTLWTYHITLDLPGRLPWKIRYNLLVETLAREVTLFKDGLLSLEFCEYEPDNCRFGRRYCTCKNLFLPDFYRALSEKAQEMIRHIHAALVLRPAGKQFQIWENHDDDDRDVELLGKPIGEWLGIDLEQIPPAEGWGYDDTLGIAEAIADLFPGQSWTWTIDAMPTERYNTAVGLLSVKSTYDYQGNFFTTSGEMAFFNRISDFYFQQRRRRRDGEDYGF